VRATIARILLTSVIASIAIIFVSTSPASACAGQSQETESDLLHSQAECIFTSDETHTMYSSGDGHTYSIVEQCHVKDVECFNPKKCSGPPPGTWFDLLRDGVPIGRVCLTASDATSLGAITPAMVFTEMKKLAWPTAELTVNPPHHRTLVNLPTIFSTDLTATQSRTVTLLGQRVTIEATPTSWVWHSGDGSDWTTDWPGAAYGTGTSTGNTDVDGLITHTYTSAATVTPSVDVVYTGRFRVEGLPGWTGIPETLTVPGASEGLTVLQATGTLTGR